MTNATPAQVPHLPPAAPGTSYRLRRIARDTYVTTGTFPDTAPDATRPYLYRAGVLILDCDLADWFLRAAPEAERKDRELRKRVKEAMFPWPAETLEPALVEHATFANQAVAHLLGQFPTVTVSSGYGCHIYCWLQDAQGYGAEIDLAQRTNAALVHRINALCGFDLADPQAHDTGTRILRPIGYVNRKSPTNPRPVFVRYSTGAIFDLADVAGRLQVSAFSAPQTSASPSPGPMPLSGTDRGATGVAGPFVAGYSPAPDATAPVPDATAPVPGDDFSALFARSEAEAAEALHSLVTTCPFFLWAIEHPRALGWQSWRGAATNIAAIGGEYGRKVFHDFSKLDPERYDPSVCDTVYSDALRSAASHGPMTYAALSAAGDWPGQAPAQVKSPASLRFLGKAARLVVFNDVAIDAKTGRPLKTAGNLRKILRADDRYGKRLAFNEMAMAPEHDGRTIADEDFGAIGEYLEDSYKVSFRREWIASAVREIAAENPYHPVAGWLRGLQWDGRSRIRSVVTDVLGADDRELFVEYMRCFLIGAVARALCEDPAGVKVDTALVLKGAEGLRKSSFFAVLGGAYFSDSPMDLRKTDAFLLLRRAWIIEWAEFESTLSRHQQTVVRAFLSARVDDYRPPYGRESIRVARRCVIVGTTNEEQFFYDPNGSRRFWVIDVPGRVDLDLLASMRDQLWAEAVALYRSGAQHWLSESADQERRDLATRYQQEEPWEALIARFVLEKHRHDVSIEEILLESVQKEAKDWRPADASTIGRVLRKLGYERYFRTIEGRREYRYRRPGTAPEGAENGPNVVPLHGAGVAFRPELVALFGGKQ